MTVNITRRLNSYNIELIAIEMLASSPRQAGNTASSPAGLYSKNTVSRLPPMKYENNRIVITRVSRAGYLHERFISVYKIRIPLINNKIHNDSR